MTFQCPSCGADIPLQHFGVALWICPYCHGTCVVGEGGVAPHEVRAALLDPEGPLEVGARGQLSASLGGGSFEVAGQGRYESDGGGWDEWFLSLDQGRWAVAERCEGSWLLYGERRTTAPVRLAGHAPGDLLRVGPDSVRVTEVGSARLVGGRGALSAPFASGETFRFALGSCEHRAAKVAADGLRSVLSLGREADEDDFQLA